MTDFAESAKRARQLAAELGRNRPSFSGASPPDGRESSPAMRPKLLDEFVGQAHVRERLRIAVQAARIRNAPLDHVLLSGPAGLGKTTLALILANEMASRLHETSGPALRRTADLATILTRLNEHDVLFIDEIHRLSATLGEFLYPALEDFAVTMMVGSRPLVIDLARFTLVGATTNPGRLAAPLRDRMGLEVVLDLYEPAEITGIVRRSAHLEGLSLNEAAVRRLADASRGTPRIANRLVRRLRDYTLARDVGPRPQLVDVDAMLGFEMIRADGLTALDVRYLKALVETYRGGPVGLEALGQTISVDAETLSETVEPWLLRSEYIARTPTGRIALLKAHREVRSRKETA